MKIKELLSDPSKWTKHTYARTADGTDCPTKSDEAVCFCLLGAVLKCYPLMYAQTHVIKALSIALRDKYGAPSIHRWNDEMATFEDVKALVEELNV